MPFEPFRTPSERSSDRLLEKLTPGLPLGGACFGAVSTVERALHHNYVYARVEDVLTHLSIAIVVGIAYGSILSLLTTLGLRVVDRGWFGSRARALWIVGAILGLAFGAFAYRLVLLPSKYAATLSPWIAVPVLIVVGAGSGGIGMRLARSGLRRAPQTVGCGALICALGVGWFDLHYYLRSYGNVHLVSAVLSYSLAGLAATTLLPRSSRSRRVAWIAITLVGLVCAGHAFLRVPSMSLRMAVLEFGAAEKLVVQHVLWTLFDRDGDGYSALFWGNDCDDHSALVAPSNAPFRLPEFDCDALVTERFGGPVQVASHDHPQQSLIWILLDTWRSDTPETLPQAFDTFVQFERFRSCGSRTGDVMKHLLGASSCSAAGPHSLPQGMESAGYAVRFFGYYEVVPGLFPSATIAGSAEKTLEGASSWIAEQRASAKPYFVFAHLKGGHHPYDGAGKTGRERYESAVHNALESVARFVAAAPSDAVIVVTGDHGEEFGEHEGRTHASSLYEEALATRAIIRAPGWPAHAETRLVGCTSLLGAINAAVAGKPYAVEERAPVFALLDSPRGIHGGLSRTVVYALRFDESWKVSWKPQVGIWELYNLKSDPHERMNLADQQPALLRTAATALMSIVRDCDTPTASESTSRASESGSRSNVSAQR